MFYYRTIFCWCKLIFKKCIQLSIWYLAYPLICLCTIKSTINWFLLIWTIIFLYFSTMLLRVCRMLIQQMDWKPTWKLWFLTLLFLLDAAEIQTEDKSLKFKENSCLKICHQFRVPYPVPPLICWIDIFLNL